MKLQHSRTLVNILLALIIAAVCILLFILTKGDFNKSDTTVAQYSPTITRRPAINVPTDVSDKFSDGLGTPDKITRGTLDEFGAGIESIAEFNRDINNDGKTDRITRTHIATGNAHDYDEYKIELNKNGKMQDITPQGFRTTRGADCALRLIQFHFKPVFGATIISRQFKDTWNTPSMATKTEYKLENNQITNTPSTQMKTVCDVKDLF